MSVTISGSVDVIVDDEDADRASCVKWSRSTRGGHAKTHISIDGKRQTVLIHNFLFGQPLYGRVWDHANGNGLDNRKCNIRLVTWADNSLNKKIYKNNTSGVRGVYLTKNGLWIAQIGRGGQRSFRSFRDKESAVRWRLAMEIELFGEMSPHLSRGEQCA